MSVPGDFQQLLNIYKNYYAAYKVTGNVGYKSAYERALNGVNDHIARMNVSMSEDAAQIRDFMATYEKSNGIITNLDNNIKGIKKEGPTLQNDYEQTKRLHQKEIEAVDNTYAYVKGAIVAGLLIAVGIIGAL
jgi:hypothetical protein